MPNGSTSLASSAPSRRHGLRSSIWSNKGMEPLASSLRCAALRPESERVAHHHSSPGQEGKGRATGPCGRQGPLPGRAAESSKVRSSGDNGPHARSRIWPRTWGGGTGGPRVKDRLTARQADAAKEALRQCHQAGGQGRDVAAPLPRPSTPAGLQVPSSGLRGGPLGTWVRPPRPTLAWSPNRKDGDGGGGQGGPGKRRPAGHGRERVYCPKPHGGGRRAGANDSAGRARTQPAGDGRPCGSGNRPTGAS
jgi:hypothetical protein